MKTLQKISVITFVFLMIFSASLYAQQGKGYADRKPGVCSQIPDLTEEQQSKIEDLRVNHLKEMNVFKSELGELRAKKHTLMTSGADLKEINAVIDKITEVQNKKMKQSAKHRSEVRALLTDEQKVYFDSKPMRRHGKSNGDRRQGRGNRHGNRAS